MVVRLSLKVGIAAMILVWFLAAPLSVLLNEPDLAWYLRVCAVDIPILCLGQAYRNVLIGTGNYQAGAVARAGRWLARMCLVVVLVEAGLSITGALLGVIGASVAELWLSRWYLGAGMFIKQSRLPIPIQRYGALLFLSSLCLIFYNGMDLFMLKILGGTATQAGIYSAAQSLSLLPGLFSWAFSSLLLATLSRQLADRQGEQARSLLVMLCASRVDPPGRRNHRRGAGDRASRVRHRVYAGRTPAGAADCRGRRECNVDGVVDDYDGSWLTSQDGDVHGSVGPVGPGWSPLADPSIRGARSRARHRWGLLTWGLCRRRERVRHVEGVATGRDLLVVWGSARRWCGVGWPTTGCSSCKADRLGMISLLAMVDWGFRQGEIAVVRFLLSEEGKTGKSHLSRGDLCIDRR